MNPTIAPTGLLSQGGRSSINADGSLNQPQQPAYVPQPINMGINNAATKPAADWVNVDQAQAAQQAAQQAAAKPPEKGGMSVICTYYYGIGKMSDDIYYADEKYGRTLSRLMPDFMAWYTRNALPIVSVISSNKLASAILWPFVDCWSREMAYRVDKIGKGNLFGSALMWTGFKVFSWSR